MGATSQHVMRKAGNSLRLATGNGLPWAENYSGDGKPEPRPPSVARGHPHDRRPIPLRESRLARTSSTESSTPTTRGCSGHISRSSKLGRALRLDDALYKSLCLNYYNVGDLYRKDPGAPSTSALAFRCCSKGHVWGTAEVRLQRIGPS